MHKTAEIGRLIHENLNIIALFAYGQPEVKRALQTHFKGEWKYLHRTIYEAGEIRADRALLEMATQLRVLDDTENFGELFKSSFGLVTQVDWKPTELYFRDMTNKVMHGAEFRWELGKDDGPRVVITPHDEKRWRFAQVEVNALMALVGQIVF